jgi:hypothetical protein
MSPEGDRREADYSWANEWETMGFCLALIENRSPAEALRLLVRNPQTDLLAAPQAREWAELHETDLRYATTVEAAKIESWAVVVELSGYEGTLEEVIRRISAGSRAVVIFSNVNALMLFQWAVDGEIIRQFDPLLYTSRHQWVGPPLAHEADLSFGSPHAPAAAFACSERLTGIRLTQDRLDERSRWLAVAHYPTP